MAITLVLGLLSGWQELALRFADRGSLRGRRGWFGSGAVGWVHFGGCLITGMDVGGLQLRVWYPFRIGFPNLQIPWDQVEDLGPSGLLGLSRSYRLGGRVTLRAELGLGDRIRDMKRMFETPTPKQVGRPTLHPRPSGLRCPYCHDTLASGKVEQCAHCHTPQHRVCLKEAAGCVVHACPGGRRLIRVG